MVSVLLLHYLVYRLQAEASRLRCFLVVVEEHDLRDICSLESDSEFSTSELVSMIRAADLYCLEGIILLK